MLTITCHVHPTLHPQIAHNTRPLCKHPCTKTLAMPSSASNTHTNMFTPTSLESREERRRDGSYFGLCGGPGPTLIELKVDDSAAQPSIRRPILDYSISSVRVYRPPEQQQAPAQGYANLNRTSSSHSTSYRYPELYRSEAPPLGGHCRNRQADEEQLYPAPQGLAGLVTVRRFVNYSNIAGEIEQGRSRNQNMSSNRELIASVHLVC